jgi:hypothetical protein
VAQEGEVRSLRLDMLYYWGGDCVPLGKAERTLLRKQGKDCTHKELAIACHAWRTGLVDQFPRRYSIAGEDVWGPAYDACPHRHLYGYKTVKQISSLPLLAESLRQRLIMPILDEATQPAHLLPVRQYCAIWRRLNAELHRSTSTWAASWTKISNELDTIERRMAWLTQTWTAQPPRRS